MYTLCAAAISLFALQVHGYANPGSCSGACNVHDPGLIQRDDGVYFRFSTGNKISYAQSSSIEGPWTAVGSVVPDGSSIDKAGNDDLWVFLSHSPFLLRFTQHSPPRPVPRHQLDSLIVSEFELTVV